VHFFFFPEKFFLFRFLFFSHLRPCFLNMCDTSSFDPQLRLNSTSSIICWSICLRAILFSFLFFEYIHIFIVFSSDIRILSSTFVYVVYLVLVYDVPFPVNKACICLVKSIERPIKRHRIRSSVETRSRRSHLRIDDRFRRDAQNDSIKTEKRENLMVAQRCLND
jgi:hypothetical protein